MKNSDLLKIHFDAWHKTYSESSAFQIITTVEKILKSNKMNSVSFELWNQWLDTTRKSQFLYSLQNRDLLNRWAEAAFQVIRHTNFSLRHLYEQKLQEHPRKVLFRDMSGEMSSQWSYEQINRHMKEIAATFYTIISEEPRVAIWTENSVESASCDLACLFYDILVSPISVHFDIKNLHYIFKKLKINIVVTDTVQRLNQLQNLQTKMDYPFKCLVLDPTLPTDDREIYFLGEYCKRLNQKEILKILSKRKHKSIDQVATVMFTSGSTGKPKGVSFSIYNLVTKRFARGAALPKMGKNEVFLCYLPLYHTFGRFLELLGTIYWGGTYVFSGNPSAETLISLFPKINPTGFISIPLRWVQLYERCLEGIEPIPDPEMQNVAIRSVVGNRLRWGLSAAGFLDTKIFQFFQRHGIELCSGFGMTEAAGGITMTPPGKYIANTHGIPLPGIELRFGKKRELQVKGHYIGRYLDEKGPEDTIPVPDEPKSDYWLRTGDLFDLNPDGYYSIVDRIKDIYKNNKGQTIAPRKVEDKFLNVPGIKRTFLVGDAKPYNVLFIVPDNEDSVIQATSSEEQRHEYFHQIIAAANEDLASYERIINFSILDRDFNIEKKEITPKGSYNRKNITIHFSQQIDDLYRSHYIELKRNKIVVKIPRWFFRDLSILEDDIQFTSKGLRNRQTEKILTIQRKVKENTIQIGDLEYTPINNMIDLGLFARQPLLWLGNPGLIAFCPIKEGWDVPVRLVSEQTYRPWHATLEYTIDKLPKLDTIRNPNLVKVNNLVSIMLFSDTDTSMAAMKQLRKMMNRTDTRLAEAIRHRLEVLARHPQEQIRVFAYQILLLHDPRPTHNKAFPAFIKSGLSFLNQESIEVIAFSKLEIRRLEALRDRLFNYRMKLQWPASKAMRHQFATIFQLLVSFVNYHPEFYNSIRAELASWILHKDDPELAKVAEREFKTLYKNFEAKLEAETPVYTKADWNKRIIFENGLSPNEINRIKKVLIGTTFLKQSIMLAFDEYTFDLSDIPNGGIWISRISVSHHYLLYRMSINTLSGKHFDIQLVLRETLQVPAVVESVHWLEAVTGHPYGPPVLPRFGCYRPELGARSMVFLNEISVWGKIRQISSIHFPGGPFPNPQAWRKLFVEAMAAFFRGWQHSGKRIVPGAVFPHNVVVSELDFRESAMILSLVGWCYYKNPLSLVEQMLKHFFFKTVAHYPWCQDQLNETWIFDACLETMGKEAGIEFLSKLSKILKKKSLQSLNGESLFPLLDEYLSERRKSYYQPLPLLNAMERYKNWKDVNPSAMSAAKEQTILDLYKLYRLDRFPEICRYYLYRYTYYSNVEKNITTSFDTLLQTMYQNMDKPAIQLIELSDLQSMLKKSEDREVFSHMVFPRFQSRHKLDVLKVGESEDKQVIVYSHITDRYGSTYTVREPIEPAEIGQLYRLFLNENFPKTISEQDRHLVVTDAQDRIVGGLCYQLRSKEVAQLEGTVVTGSLKERGIGTALIEDFTNRMESQGISVLIAHFFLQPFYLKLGFKVDKSWGALVKFLTPVKSLEEDIGTETIEVH